MMVEEASCVTHPRNTDPADEQVLERSLHELQVRGNTMAARTTDVVVVVVVVVV